MPLLALLLALALGACRGAPPDANAQATIDRLVDSLAPAVERATGLTFQNRPRVELRTRDEVRAFILAKVAEEFPPERIRGVTTAYQLLGLIPDTLDLQALLLDLYTEQVAGFYDPAAGTLYAVEGADPAQLRLVIAHELVHALQDEQLPLDSLLGDRTSSDRTAAIQAVLEGHATIASLRVLVPGGGMLDRADFWQNFRQQIRETQTSMDVFRRSPMVLREGLVFPYLAGSDFMRWWEVARPGQPLPDLETLPRSTEQILHPERFHAGDAPLPVAFADTLGAVLIEDTFGEMQLHILAAHFRGGEVTTSLAAGWGGDRFRVYDTEAGPVLVWWKLFDSEVFARRYRVNTGQRLLDQGRAGYRIAMDSVQVNGHAAVRTVIAPAGWDGWERVPGVVVTP